LSHGTRQPALPRLRSSLTIGAHFVVDVFSFIPIALMPALAFLLDIAPEQKALLFGIGSVASGGIQPIVAWLSDKLHTTAIGTIGMVVAVLAIGNLGQAESFTELMILYGVGVAGVGAYHPPAAAAVGALAGKHRARWIALFFLFGMLGGIVGNKFTPDYVQALGRAPDGTIDLRNGLLDLRYTIPVGLAVAVVLAWSLHGVSRNSRRSTPVDTHWDPPERKLRWRAVTLLYFSNMIRFGVNMSLIYLFTEWADAVTLERNNAPALTEALSAQSSHLNGNLQAAMQVGMGGGGIVLGFILAARFEKLVFFVLPLLGSFAIVAITFADNIAPELAVPAAVTGSVLSGVGFGAVIPVSISLAQRMLPHRMSLASGLMLGGAWCFAFVGPLIVETVQNGLAAKRRAPGWLLDWARGLPEWLGGPLLDGMGLDAGFIAAAGALFVAGLITLWLPRDLMRRTHQD